LIIVGYHYIVFLQLAIGEILEAREFIFTLGVLSGGFLSKAWIALFRYLSFDFDFSWIALFRYPWVDFDLP
jgi:hypothetical protein